MRHAEARASRMEASWHRILQREEQRVSARHVAVVNSAWIAWEDPSGQVLSEDANLLDISRGGASVQVVRFAPYRSLWLCIEAGGKVWGVRFETIEEHTNPLTGNRIRGRFPNSCPEEFYRIALRGYREKNENPSGQNRQEGGFLGWVKDKITRKATPEAGSSSDIAASRERAVRRLSEGAVEVVMGATIDEPSVESRVEFTSN